MVGRSRDREGMEMGVIETGVNETGGIETNAIEMLDPSRIDGVVVVATVEVMLGDAAEQASSSDKAGSE